MRHQPSSIRILIACLAMMTISFGVCGQATAPAASGSSTTSKPSAGTTIGTMVKDAITAALPGVSSIIKLIWGTNPSSNKRAADANNALTNTAGQTALQKSAQQQAKPFIQPVTQVADELAVVEKFASASSQAATNLVTMQTLLTTSPQPNNLLKSLQEEWGLASDLLAPLFAQGVEADIKKVRDPSVQGTLLQIHAANTNVAGRIANRMKATKLTDIDLPALKDLVSALLGLLSGTNSVAAAELNNLQQELSALAVWANSPSQGGENLDKVTPDANLMKFAAAKVKAANDAADRYPDTSH
jgi:hypothetical protein